MDMRKGLNCFILAGLSSEWPPVGFSEKEHHDAQIFHAQALWNRKRNVHAMLVGFSSIMGPSSLNGFHNLPPTYKIWHVKVTGEFFYFTLLSPLHILRVVNHRDSETSQLV